MGRGSASSKQRGHGQLWGALEKIRECYLEKVTLGDWDIASVCICVGHCGQREQPSKGGEEGACKELMSRGAAQP